MSVSNWVALASFYLACELVWLYQIVKSISAFPFCLACGIGVAVSILQNPFHGRILSYQDGSCMHYTEADREYCHSVGRAGPYNTKGLRREFKSMKIHSSPCKNPLIFLDGLSERRFLDKKYIIFFHNNFIICISCRSHRIPDFHHLQKRIIFFKLFLQMKFLQTRFGI